MALTRDFKETVAARVQSDPAFAQALLDEAITLFIDGEPDTAKLILRDLVNATVGFESLAEEIHKPAKSLHRMLSASGNPTMSNISAIFGALRPGVRGIFNLAGPPPLPLSRLIGFTGRTRISVPHFLATSVIKRLWRYRATSFPAPELDHIRYVCMVDDRRAREVIGYRPAHDIAETVRAVDDVCWPLARRAKRGKSGGKRA